MTSFTSLFVCNVFRFEVHEAGFSAVLARAQADILQEPGEKKEKEKDGDIENEEKEDKDHEDREVGESWFLVAGSTLVTPEGEVKLLWN